MNIAIEGWSDEELEEVRIQALEEQGELDGYPGPGSLYCHEALHMTSFLTSSIDTELCNHPAITANKEWFTLAMLAQAVLASLYQKMGSLHLGAENPNG